MRKPRIPTYLTVAVIFACVFWFAVCSPLVGNGLLTTLLPPDLQDSGLWDEMETWALFGMFLMGIPLGVHVGMLLTQRTVRLDCGLNRGIFTILSGICAVIVTILDLSDGEFIHDFSPFFHLIYLLVVQIPPLLWFAYNLNAQTLQMMLIHRRKRIQ